MANTGKLKKRLAQLDARGTDYREVTMSQIVDVVGDLTIGEFREMMSIKDAEWLVAGWMARRCCAGGGKRPRVTRKGR